MSSKVIICLIGLPGTGKGTQGRMLAKDKQFFFISTGDLVKRVCTDMNDKDFCENVRKYYLTGEPQPDANIERIINMKLSSMKLDRGIVFDQFPFNLKQSQLLETLVDKYKFDNFCVFYFDVPEKVLLDRLLLRKYCPIDNKTYGPNSPNYESNTCECGEPLTVREDDNKDTILNRFMTNKKRLDEVINYFEDHGRLIKINGDQSIEAVQAELMTAIDNYFDKI